MVAALPILVFILATLGPPVGLLWVLRALMRRLRAAPKFVVWTAQWLWLMLALVTGVSAIVGTHAAVAMSASPRGDDVPKEKARLLGERIAEMMNVEAVLLLVLVAAFAWTIFWNWRLRRDPR
jgi:hypothetical protein